LSEIYLAGNTSSISNSSDGTIYKSTDGGVNWTEVTISGLDPTWCSYSKLCYTGNRFLMLTSRYINSPQYEFKIYATSGSSITDQKIISLAGDLSFGDIAVNQSAQKILMIRNTGNISLTISDIGLSTGFSTDWTSGIIAAGETKNVTILFTSTEEKNYSGTITIEGDFTSGTNTIPISGNGKMGVQRIISLSGNLAFGDVTVNETEQRTLVIKNSGNALMAISDMEIPEGFSADWVNGVIEGGKEKQVIITFTPAEVKSYSGSITLYGNFSSGINELLVSGNGVYTTSNKHINSTAFSFVLNPEDNSLTIRSDHKINLITIYNTVGGKMYESKPYKYEAYIDINRYQKGIYFVIINGDSISDSFKIMKK